MLSMCSFNLLLTYVNILILYQLVCDLCHVHFPDFQAALNLSQSPEFHEYLAIPYSDMDGVSKNRP